MTCVFDKHQHPTSRVAAVWPTTSIRHHPCHREGSPMSTSMRHAVRFVCARQNIKTRITTCISYQEAAVRWRAQEQVSQMSELKTTHRRFDVWLADRLIDVITSAPTDGSQLRKSAKSIRRKISESYFTRNELTSRTDVRASSCLCCSRRRRLLYCNCCPCRGYDC